MATILQNNSNRQSCFAVSSAARAETVHVFGHRQLTAVSVNGILQWLASLDGLHHLYTFFYTGVTDHYHYCYSTISPIHHTVHHTA